jgi:hypothetical protein
MAKFCVSINKHVLLTLLAQPFCCGFWEYRNRIVLESQQGTNTKQVWTIIMNPVKNTGAEYAKLTFLLIGWGKFTGITNKCSFCNVIAYFLAFLKPAIAIKFFSDALFGSVMLLTTPVSLQLYG